MTEDTEDLIPGNEFSDSDNEGQELWEHHRFIAEKGQNLL